MPRFDPHRKPSPTLEKRAMREYGDVEGRPEILVFCALVAGGESLASAYQQAISTDCSDATASSQASILAAHPWVRDRIIWAGLPAQTYVRSMVPEALKVLGEQLTSDDPKVRQKAANSILDRGGVPRVKQQHTHLRAEVAVSGEALIELAAKLGDGSEHGSAVRRGDGRQDHPSALLPGLALEVGGRPGELEAENRAHGAGPSDGDDQA